MQPLSPQDQQLIETATAAITRYFHPKKHRLATTLATADGQIVTGINLEGSFGCNDVCAEQITLGKAISDGLTQIDTIVTIKHPKPEDTNQELRVASPCGKCRELINDYAPQTWVIVRQGDQIGKVRIGDLLPYRYSK
jgi:cytidine deaminase